MILNLKHDLDEAYGIQKHKQEHRNPEEQDNNT